MRKSKIDEHLKRLCETIKPGTMLGCREIAAECGCDKELIRNIEKRALKKIRRRLGPEGMSAVAAFFTGRTSQA
jgi:DNA-directed RNA polymerase sigma subunit (sigma70/sigma32)